MIVSGNRSAIQPCEPQYAATRIVDLEAGCASISSGLRHVGVADHDCLERLITRDQ